MPQRRSPIKDLRKNEKRHAHNLDIKSDIKRTMKSFNNLIAEKNKEEAKNTLNLLYKKFDKATKKNVIAKNTASRRKSRFSRILASIA